MRQEDAWAQRIARTLDDSADTLDAGTLSQIHAARSRALDQLVARKRMTWWAGSLAAACASVLLVTTYLRQPAVRQPLPLDDMALISSADDIELLENLEFYEWLAADELEG